MPTLTKRIISYTVIVALVLVAIITTTSFSRASNNASASMLPEDFFVEIVYQTVNGTKSITIDDQGVAKLYATTGANSTFARLSNTRKVDAETTLSAAAQQQLAKIVADQQLPQSPTTLRNHRIIGGATTTLIFGRGTKKRTIEMMNRSTPALDDVLRTIQNQLPTDFHIVPMRS